MKLNTLFGQIETKTKKVFGFQNSQFAIIDYPYKYMNLKEPLVMRSVIHLKSGVPITIMRIYRGDTLKVIEEKALKTFENLIAMHGQDAFNVELKKFESIS